jgi:hypothetical protein
MQPRGVAGNTSLLIEIEPIAPFSRPLFSFSAIKFF